MNRVKELRHQCEELKKLLVTLSNSAECYVSDTSAVPFDVDVAEVSLGILVHDLEKVRKYLRENI